MDKDSRDLYDDLDENLVGLLEQEMRKRKEFHMRDQSKIETTIHKIQFAS
jgi:hypothetical protein